MDQACGISKASVFLVRAPEDRAGCWGWEGPPSLGEVALGGIWEEAGGRQTAFIIFPPPLNLRAQRSRGLLWGCSPAPLLLVIWWGIITEGNLWRFIKPDMNSLAQLQQWEREGNAGQKHFKKLMNKKHIRCGGVVFIMKLHASFRLRSWL